jgi:hypothetical protein
LANIPTSSVADKLTGEFLPSNITAIAVSPATTEFFYIAKTSSGSIGNIYSVKSGVEKRAFVSSFSEWLPDWVANGIFMTTKPASSFPGVTYLQSITKSSFTRIVGGRLGLTTLANPDGTKILIAEGLNLSIININSGGSLQVQGIYTLPEKCIWKNSTELLCFGSETPLEGNYPESWYQGRSYFSDSLYTVSSVTGEASLLATIYEMAGSDIAMDATRISFSRDKNGLVIINKIDMTPWYLNLEKTTSLYTVQP